MMIAERLVGDVTILDLKGKITLGEGDELLRGRLMRMIASGRRKIILNLADVPYVDSSGNGEIVRSYAFVSRHGGQLKLLNLTKRIMDLLSLTKLLTVYETFDDERDAIRSFGSASRASVCPVCHMAAGFGSLGQPVQRCANCSSESVLSANKESRPRWIVQQVTLPTYMSEHVLLQAGWPFVLSVVGRLDLFSAETVEQAWRTVPPPRKVLIELGDRCTQVTSKGLRAVEALCLPDVDGGRTAVWLAAYSAICDGITSVEPPFFADRSAAVASLQIGDAEPPDILVDASVS